ncbi:MAG: 3-keto-disaccharide hydrolase [Mucilaginibacter sp.]
MEMKSSFTAKLFAVTLTSAFFCVNTTSAQIKPGYQKLFDGKTLNGWKRLAGTADYKVENGNIVGTTVANSGNTFLVTEKEYGDFVLEMDVKIDNPNSNSGVQVRSHFDANGHEGKGLVYGKQFEIDPSDRKWSGGIYDEGRRDWIYPLDLHAEAKDVFKVGEYNHIKIECIGNETKTWINDTPIAYVVDTIDQRGFIGLQVHGIQKASDAGEHVYFKNIQIKTAGIIPREFPRNIYVANLQPNSLSPYEKNDGWKLLFDGVTHMGWRSVNNMDFPAKGWDVSNGCLTVVGKTGGVEGPTGGDIITEDRYASFDLSFEFKTTPVANSGVKYFVTLADGTKGAALGLEYQVLDDDRHPDAKLGRNGDRKMGSLYDLIPATKQARFVKPVGTWNSGRIVVYPNNHVEHYLNGVKILEYDRGSAAFREAVALSKFKTIPNFGESKEGYILLQDHGCTVNYRNIKLKKL